MKNYATILMQLIAAGAITLLPSYSFSQVLIQADRATLQPQIKRDDRGFESCGVRAVVLSKVGKNYEAIDFSLMVGHNFSYGIMKAGKVLVTPQDLLAGDGAGKTVMPRPTYFWISQESEGKALKGIKTSRAENEGFTLQIADLTETLKTIFAIVEGRRMQIAVRYPSQRVEAVIGFSSQFSEDEKRPFLACIHGLAERIENEDKKQ